ncbi:MAG: NFACT RNA binding domain-containing protein [Myxococcota bacterium]|nr:NFACT RNA binding domain-containing protein [Myxococcota bacterium]
MDHLLVGGQVQHVALAHLGPSEVALLRIRIPPREGVSFRGESVDVVIVAGTGVGVVDDDDRTRLRDTMHGATSAAQAQWRGRLDGARVTDIGETFLALERDGSRWRAGAEESGLLALTEQAVDPGASEPGRETLAGRGARMVDDLVRTRLGWRRDALRVALQKAIVRVDRRVAHVRGDLARMQTAAAAAERAQLFVAQAAEAPRGATRLEAVDWSSGDAKRIEMPIDPARGPMEQIAAVFKRARRLKKGAAIAAARLEEGMKTRAALAEIAEGLSGPDAELAALEARARASAPRDFRLESARAPSGHGVRTGPVTRRLPYRTFLAASGTSILVGRGAADNDSLTFHTARPHHLWLHAKNHAGAHVIVPLAKGQSCPADLLVEAAHLAAHFSDVRNEDVVEVTYTPRRYLRKPRGSAPGIVVVDREKVIVLRREDAVLRVLLEREALG